MSEPTATRLAELISRLREDRQLSYRELAGRAGIPVATVHRMAASPVVARLPSEENLRALAKALEVSHELLIEAALADLGVREFRIAEGMRQTLYYEAERLSEDELYAILSIMRRLPGRVEGTVVLERESSVATRRSQDGGPFRAAPTGH